MKLVVYTAVFGNYDRILPPRERAPGVDYVCFADPDAVVPSGWSRGVLPAEAERLSPASRNRWAKMHPHVLFAQYAASVYVDGNIEVLRDLRPLADEALSGAALAMYDHPFRRCLYDEALACVRVGLDWLDPVLAQMERYAAAGFPAQRGLFEANVIVRRHSDPAVAKAMEYWWREWETGVKRDQLSLTYALWQTGTPAHSLGRHDPRFVRQFFIYRAHRRPWRGLPQRLLRRYINRARLAAGAARSLKAALRAG